MIRCQLIAVVALSVSISFCHAEDDSLDGNWKLTLANVGGTEFKMHRFLIIREPLALTVDYHDDKFTKLKRFEFHTIVANKDGDRWNVDLLPSDGNNPQTAVRYRCLARIRKGSLELYFPTSTKLPRFRDFPEKVGKSECLDIYEPSKFDFSLQLKEGPKKDAAAAQ